MKIYLCMLVECKDRIDSNTQLVRATMSRDEAERWKAASQKYEDEVSGPWKAMNQRYITRSGGGDYDEGPITVTTLQGTGAGTARVFEVDATEI